ncbi:MAG TPA: ThiF family adenylyltransferase [Thermoanaerobaculia bacterium]|nr:ThiF family adenylyltransferase [Thermoanaerobaculia bacterium]
MTNTPLVLDTNERFSRFEKVEWWDQPRLRNARVLVVGAGALGNEVIKNFALLGIGHVAIADMDMIEISNLTRSPLFRESDAGKPKAECAARAARDLYPDIDARALVGNITADLGLGWVRRADVVVGALDNREARVFINSVCARVGKPWIDGGIEVLQGVARGFHPPHTACYECTMSEVDWQVINKRRSCTMLARRALAHGGTPTTPTTASVIGAIQAQEVVKLLHGLPALLGRGFVFEGATHSSYGVTYPLNPDCPWHEEVAPIDAINVRSDQPLGNVWREAERVLGSVDALELGRELVSELECVSCGQRRAVMRGIDALTESDAVCDSCGGDSTPHFFHTIGRDRLEQTPREIGLPRWDIVWARRGERFHGFELAGDV